MTSLKNDNRRLTASVDELRAERRAQERKMLDLQRQLDQVRSNVVTAAVDGSMPELRTEVVAPPAPADGPRVIGVTDSGEEIVYEGDAALGKPAQIEDEPAPRRATTPVSNPPPAPGERIEVTHKTPPIAARSARSIPIRERELPSDRGGDAGSDYRAAVELVKSGQHDQAVAALRAFIAKFPRHDYADNAQYWLGESFYAQRDYQHSLVEFRAVIETYPRGNKVPDALLKVGYCYQAMGQTEKARAVLEQVVSLYPKTEPAALAAKRLESR